MNEEAYREQALLQLATEWSLDRAALLSEAEVLAALEIRIGRMIAGEGEAFFGLMYRLDIAERQLTQALAAANPPAAVARLVWDRQWQKARHRGRSAGEQPEDPDLKW